MVGPVSEIREKQLGHAPEKRDELLLKNFTVNSGLMSGGIKLHTIPDRNPYLTLLLAKCIRRVDRLKAFGIEKVKIIYGQLILYTP